jgi:hypothetical protein
VDADRLRGILYFSPQSLSFPGVVFALAGGALFGAFWGSLGWIEANDLKGRLDRGEAMAIIDMPGGGTDEFTGPLGHIATSRNIPIAELRAASLN